MAEAALTTDRGEQLVAEFTYPGPVTGTATFVVRAKIGDPDPPLVDLTSGTTVPEGEVTVAGQVVTVKVHGPTTANLPASSRWALWIGAGGNDATVISGALRVYEVVQP